MELGNFERGTGLRFNIGRLFFFFGFLGRNCIGCFLSFLYRG